MRAFDLRPFFSINEKRLSAEHRLSQRPDQEFTEVGCFLLLEEAVESVSTTKSNRTAAQMSRIMYWTS